MTQNNKELVKHEALHTAYLAQDMVASYILENNFVAGNSRINELAKQAHEALYKLYQAIGELE